MVDELETGFNCTAYGKATCPGLDHGNNAQLPVICNGRCVPSPEAVLIKHIPDIQQLHCSHLVHCAERRERQRCEAEHVGQTWTEMVQAATAS